MLPDEIDKISIRDILGGKFSTGGILSQIKPQNNIEQRLADLQHQYNKAILESPLMTPAEWAKKMIERPKALDESIYRPSFIPFWDNDINIEHPDPSKLNIRVKKKKRKAFNFNN